jgi:hypothetical protein
MGKGRKYIKKSADGRFFLYVDEPEYLIEPDKKTKLWLSCPYLMEESLKEDPEKTIETLNYLIKWNETNQNFETCSRLVKMRDRI